MPVTDSAFPTSAESFKPFLRLLRPRQWIKNAFVLTGLLFVKHRDPVDYLNAALAFCAFCFAASAVYIFNDIHDLEADRQHPIKSQRPLAAGLVDRFDAEIIAFTLSALALLFAEFIDGWAAPAIILAYLAINVAYTLKLKYIPILDAFIIAFGFMLRILIGTYAIGIAASDWLLLTGMALTLFLAFCKRQAEGRYECQQFITITAGCTILTYALYTTAPETVAYHHTHALLYTTPFVIYGVLRYLTLAGDDASKHITTDPYLIGACVLWLCSVLAINVATAMSVG
jgi:hypothetical protein